MIDFPGISELITQAIGVFKHHVPPGRWPNTSVWALLAVPAGLILALWGASLLRTAYVLGFLVLGGMVGVELAGVGQFDRIIGLVLGAGLAALVGHLLFRLWLGVTAGVIAVLLVAVLGGGRISQEVRKFEDQRLGIQTLHGRGEAVPEVSPYMLPAPGDGGLEAYWSELQTFFYEKNRDFLYRAGLVSGLAFLIAMAVAMIMPQWMMIAGTALIGTLAVGAGGATLLSSQRPEAWTALQQHWGWVLGGFALFLLVSVLYQARRRRSRLPAVPAAPAPA